MNLAADAEGTLFMQDLSLTLTWADALVESRTSHMQSHQIWQPPTRIGADRYENYLGGGKRINQTNPWKAESSEFSLFLVLRREENQGDQQRIILSDGHRSPSQSPHQRQAPSHPLHVDVSLADSSFRTVRSWC